MEIQYYKLAANRANITAFQAEMEKVDDKYKLDLEFENYFSLGIYARALYIPKDTILVGKIHKYPQLNILAKGKVKVSIENYIQIVEAGFIYSAPVGVQRIINALEDSIWITIHGTHLTDVDKIEEHFIAQNEDEFRQFCLDAKEGEKQLGLPLDGFDEGFDVAALARLRHEKPSY